MQSQKNAIAPSSHASINRWDCIPASMALSAHRSKEDMLKKFLLIVEWLLVTTVAFLCAAAATITVVNIADVKDGTAWAQTIGSFGAIIVAFFVGKHQADAAIESVREGDRLQTSRRYSAILAVVDTAKEYTNNTAKIFAPNNFSYVTYKCCYSERDLKSIINALEAIPAH